MKRRGWLTLICCLVFAYLIFPLVIIVPVSFSSASGLEFPPPGFSLRWYQAYFGDETWMTATLTSVEVGLLTALLASILGTAAALGLARTRFRGQGLLQAFLISPMVVPVIIMAVAIYRLYAAIGLLGTIPGLVLAHTVLAVPFVVVNVSATLTGLDPALERASLSLGADGWQTFRHVTLPLIRPGVLAGALFAFVTSFDELVIALFVSNYQTVTLPKKMWESVRTGIDPTISAISVLLIVLIAGLLAVIELLTRRTARLQGSATSGQ